MFYMTDALDDAIRTAIMAVEEMIDKWENDGVEEIQVDTIIQDLHTLIEFRDTYTRHCN